MMRTLLFVLACAAVVTLGKKHDEAKPKRETVPKPKAERPVHYPQCFETNTDYPGNDLPGSPTLAASAQACKNQCFARGGCKYWSYQPGVKECWLKNGRTGVVRVGVISGASSCSGSNCVVPNYEFSGGDLGRPELTETPLECRKRCKKHKSCVAWSYKPRVRQCYLKHTKGTGVATGAVSGPKSCASSFLTEMLMNQILDSSDGCASPNTDYPGYSLVGSPLELESPALCQQECHLRKGCRFWTYNKGSKDCWLKNAHAKPKPSGAISGSKHCRHSSCQATNIDLPGFDLQQSPSVVANAGACQRVCSKKKACKFWTYQVNVKECWLKYARGPARPSGAISGPETCD